MSNNFDQYSKYYDLLYRDKNYALETQYIHNLLTKYGRGGNKILELGSGTGKHARLLAEKGYTIYGIERSSEMVNMARQFSSNNITYEVNELSSFSLSYQFDIAISLFHVISYLTENKELVATFKNVAKHIKPGGLFIFDVWYSPAVYFQQPETRIKRLNDEEMNITRLAEPRVNTRNNVVDVNYEVIIENKKEKSFTTLTEKHPMRHFSEPEISLLATVSGFDVLHAEEFLSGQIPSEKTWGVCFILQKQ